MVDESMNLSVTPEMNRSGGGNLRRYSMGKASLFDVDERDIPHHRRTSTGSCHDFCKYGKNHSFEIKSRVPLLKRASKKVFDGRNSDQVTLPEREKTTVSVTELKASPGSETCITDSTDMVTLEVPVNSPCKESPVEIEVVNESEKLVAETKTLPNLKIHKAKTPKTTKPVIFPAKKVGVSPKQALTNSEKRRFPEKLDSSLKPKTLKVKSGRFLEKLDSSLKPKTLKVISVISGRFPEKLDSSLKPKTLKVKPVISGRFPEKLDISLKPKTLKVKPVISSASSRNTVVHRNNNSKAGKGLRSSEGIGMKMAVNPITSLKPKPIDGVAKFGAMKNKNTKVVSPLKSQNKMRKAQTKDAQNVEVKEKTLYVVNMEIKCKLVESDQSAKNASELYSNQPSSPYKSSSIANFPSLSPHREDQDESKYTRNVDASFSASNELDSIKKGKASSGNKKGQSPRMLQSKGKDFSSLSLNFRKGKVIDVHSESHSPRRLKFRQGRLLADSQQSKDGRRTTFEKVVVSEIFKDSIPPSEKVVLRHQDVQGKKDTQVLLNNVIEETASKLVRTRKSKVKALVGAFETVISLQDNKPSWKTIA